MQKTYYPTPELVALQVRHAGRLTKAALIAQGDLEYWVTPEKKFKKFSDGENLQHNEMVQAANAQVHKTYGYLAWKAGKWEANGKRLPVYAKPPNVPHTVRGTFDMVPHNLPEGYLPTPDDRRADRHQVMQASQASRPRSGGDLDPCAGKAPSHGLDNLIDEVSRLELDIARIIHAAGGERKLSFKDVKRIRSMRASLEHKTNAFKSGGARYTARMTTFAEAHSHAPQGKAAPARVKKEVARD